MSEGRPNVFLELDPNSIARIIDTAVVTSTEVVSFHFNALAGANLAEPVQLPEAIFMFRGPELSADQRRSMHESWILAKAFQELLRAVRHALEVAHVCMALLTKAHKVKSSTTIADFLRPFEAKAASLKFSQLLADVNAKLATKLEFSDSYKSLQSARNCLEHRAGIVGKPDTHGKESFELSVPRMKIFYIRKGVEVEIEKGKVVEPGDDRAEVPIMMKLEVRKRSLALGARIIFTLAEFNEIAFACHFLGGQIAARMPKPLVPN